MKLGIALSGGGIRGIAHAGVLKALEENNIKIDIIGGTSSGSLVSALYAMGYSPDEIYELFKKHAKEIATISSWPIISGITNYMRNKSIRIKGLRSNQRLEELCDKLADKKGIKAIDDLKMPIVIPTVDIISEREYIFTNYLPNKEEQEDKYITNISIGKAVRASSSFSAVFCPFEYEKYAFMDGGILDNVPVEEVKKQGADKVIAISFESDKITENSNIMDIVMKTVDIMGDKVFEPNLKQSDYNLVVSTDGTGLLDLRKMDMCFQFGYDTTIRNIDKIKAAIK